jgi:hypothetical protein
LTRWNRPPHRAGRLYRLSAEGGQRLPQPRNRSAEIFLVVGALAAMAGLEIQLRALRELTTRAASRGTRSSPGSSWRVPSGIDRRLGNSLRSRIDTTGRHGFWSRSGTPSAALSGALLRVSLWSRLGPGLGFFSPRAIRMKRHVRLLQPRQKLLLLSSALGAAVTRDLDVAEESPSPNLNLGTFAGFHVDALISKERGSAGGHAGARRNAQSDVSC